MVLGGLGLTYARSMTAIPASTAIAPRKGVAADGHELGFNSAAVVLSLFFTAGVALALSRWLEEGALDGALFVGLWMFRSHLRTVFFARGRERMVGISDLCFTLSGALGAVAAIMPGGPHVLDHIFMVLILCNGIGVAVMLALARRRPSFERARLLWRRYRALWPVLSWSFISVTITNLQGQGMALMVGAFAGPAAYAPIAAAIVVFMPLRVVAMGFANMMLRSSPRSRRRATQPASAASCGCGSDLSPFAACSIWGQRCWRCPISCRAPSSRRHSTSRVSAPG